MAVAAASAKLAAPKARDRAEMAIHSRHGPVKIA